MADDAATRKARQRQRDRAAGLIEILVKIHKTRVSEMREVEVQMRTPDLIDSLPTAIREPEKHVSPAPERFNAWLRDTDDHLPDDFEPPV